MPLHFTLASTTAGTVELTADSPAVPTGAALVQNLEQEYGPGPYTVEGLALEDLTPGIGPLCNGAVVVRGRSKATGNVTPSLMFAINSGPDAGQLYPLLRGSYEIGRTGCAISINDPELSRHHAVLTVADHHIELRDHGSANGTWVDGVRTRTALVDAGSRIRFGSSFASIVPGVRPEDGPRVADVREPLLVQAPPPPEKNRLMIVTALLPLVLGIVLALTTGMWFFLAFSALSAVTGLVSLLTGKRKRRQFAEAVDAAALEDTRRRRCGAPDAAALALAARTGTNPNGDPARCDATGLPLRLGLADQVANIVVVPAQPGWTPPLIQAVPAIISAAPLQSMVIQGPHPAVEGLGRSLLVQLSVAGASTVSFGSAPEMPAAARFLPGSLLVSDTAELAAATQRKPPCTVLVWGKSAEARTVLKNCGNTVIWLHESSPETDVAITVSAGSGRLRSGDSVLAFVPDLLGTRTFDNMSRALSRAPRDHRNDAITAVPDEARLDAVSASTSEDVRQAWSTGKTGLCAALGVTLGGPLSFDLVTQGPHVLVAGTTGAGKSELLRSLILGIAAAHPPSAVNFLLIDFKGGSGLSVLSGLPHSVGLLTDLSGENVSRALISLRAEVRRREQLFADQSVSDLTEYTGLATQIQLPRLILVIDEFRMLTEEVPTAIAELMHIATLGRSLGIHLIMSTQRPQGAVTSDIRANVTASICLRVQSELDSRDVLGDRAAADIPVQRPGRGYLRVGNDPLVEFQSVTTLGSADTLARMRPVVEFPTFLEAASRTPPHTGTDTQLDSMIRAINSAAVGHPPQFEPISPPLPENLPAHPAWHAREPGSGAVYAGLLDLPEEQQQRTLAWDPGADSHLALLGIPGSGSEDALRSLAGSLARRPALHHYVLDGEGLLPGMAGLGSVGAYVAGHEVKRAARTLKRISEEITERLAAGTCAHERGTPLLLTITGWGRWVSVLRASRWAWAEDVLGDIIRDGEKARICVLLTGDRELLGARFFSLIPNRMFLPHGSSPESLMMWPKLPRMDPLPGRAFVQGRIRQGRTAQGPTARSRIAQGPITQRRSATAAGAIAQLAATDADNLAGYLENPCRAPEHRPFRVEPLPGSVTTRMIDGAPPAGMSGPAEGDASESVPAAGSSLRIPVGLGGNELEVIRLSLPPHSVTAVIGGQGSGRTNLMLLLAAGLPEGWASLCPTADEDPVAFWTAAAHNSAGPANPVRSLLLVDDADRLPQETHQRLSELHAAGASVVFTATPGAALMSKVPLAMEARSRGTGLVLSPRQASDADFFGIRLEPEGRQPPGRAYLIDAGTTAEIQLARADAAAVPATAESTA